MYIDIHKIYSGCFRFSCKRSNFHSGVPRSNCVCRGNLGRKIDPPLKRAHGDHDTHEHDTIMCHALITMSLITCDFTPSLEGAYHAVFTNWWWCALPILAPAKTTVLGCFLTFSCFSWTILYFFSHLPFLAPALPTFRCHSLLFYYLSSSAE